MPFSSVNDSFDFFTADNCNFPHEFLSYQYNGVYEGSNCFKLCAELPDCKAFILMEYRWCITYYRGSYSPVNALKYSGTSECGYKRSL